jgi:two-component sensor histidine kinase
VPNRRGDVWASDLATLADATRMRKDLRAQLAHSRVAGGSTESAGEDLLLAFEELTSNALRYGKGAVHVQIVSSPTGWLLVVDDESPDLAPVPAVNRDRALGGMGLAMVSGFALGYGWCPSAGHKRVWAELPTRR